MQWCGSGGEVWFDNYGPSECLCYSTAVLVPSVLLVFYLIFKYVYNILLKADQEFYASSSQRLLYVTMGLFFLNPVIFSVVAFVARGGDSGSNIFPAKVVGVSVNILAWMICMFSVYYDFHCRLPWPCAGIRYFLFAEVLTHAVTISSIYSTQRNNFKLILGSVSFLITLTLLVLALFKERFSIFCDRARFKFSDEKFYSEDHYSEATDSFTSANINVSFQDNNRMQRSKRSFLGFFSFSDGNTMSVDTDAEEGLLGRTSDLSDASSFYSGHYRDSITTDRNSIGGTSLSGRTHGHEEPSLVQSIMDRNLQPLPQQHEHEGSFSTSISTSTSSSPSSPTKPPSGQETSSGDSSQAPTLSPSGALARVLRTSSHRSALALSQSSSSSSGVVGGLAPRGQVSKQYAAGGVGMGMRAKDIQSSNSNNNNNTTEGSHTKLLEDLQIRMGKYGFRRENSPYYGRSGVNSSSAATATAESSGLNEESDNEESKQFPTRLSSFDTHVVGPDGSVNRPKVLREAILGYDSFNTESVEVKDRVEKEVDLVNMSPVSSLLMEVEFEILFRLPAMEGEEGAEGEKDREGGSGSGERLDEVPQQWCVWRTGKELLSLHAVMVGRLGDLAPRRPKITTVGPQPDTSTISRESILTDTRVMGGYLRALVSQSLFHFPEFCSFCDLPLALVPPPVVKPESTVDSTVPTATALSRETSGTVDKDSKDQWRRIFLNLRKNLKPRELAARCRVYDGVVCGKDITKWLLTSTYKYAHDYTEAHRIAQGLLEADLLSPVCAGYDHTLQLQPRDSEISRSTAAGGGTGMISSTQNIVKDKETLATFKSHPSYIYRYPGRLGTSSGIGAFSMFAHRVVTSIPTWFQADVEDTSTSSIINYTVRSCLLDEQWEVFRRFNEFSQFHKALQKEGIKPTEAFPTTSFSMLLLGQVSSANSSTTEVKLKERAIALELYLSSAIEAIMLAVRDLPGDSYSDIEIYSESSSPHQRHRLLTLLATFLDDEHLHLRLCCPSSSSPTVSTSTGASTQDQLAINLDEHVDSLVI